MSAVLNIAAYKFVELDQLERRRVEVFDQASRHELKGTVLISHEGINIFLAGTAAQISAFLHWLQEDPVFTELEVKYSESTGLPFKRLKVKIKSEIIRMNHPTIRPIEGRAPAVDAHTAARWIQNGCDDAGKPVVLLDTRNDFEVQAGTFKNAINWHLGKFTDFPPAVEAHQSDLEGKTVISFCTGGIRCEKAAIYMTNLGLKDVYQLDGGILKYFELTGGIGFEGTCFVFDERETLDPDLKPKALPAG